MLKTKSLAFLLGLFTASLGVASNLVVIGNDQTVRYRQNRMEFLETPSPGSLTVLDFGTFPPAAREVPAIPLSVIGPPTCVALIPESSLALVAQAMATENKDGAYIHVPRSTITLVDLDGAALATIATGLQPSGVSVRKDGRIALVANRGDGTISVLQIGLSPASLKEIGRTKIAEAAESVAHVEISPDGRYAVASLSGPTSPAVLVLALDEVGNPTVIQRLPGGVTPYSVRFLPDGNGFFVADVGADNVALFEFSEGRAKLRQKIPVGRIPEGLDISADGEWVAVSCFQGANLLDETHPKYGQKAEIFVLRREVPEESVAGAVYGLETKIPVRGAPQFAVFSADGRYLVVSATGYQALDIYRSENGNFIKTGPSMKVNGEPVAAIGSRP